MNARFLSYWYATAFKKTFPSKWSEDHQAGVKSMRSVMKRHSQLSYGKPENVGF